MSLHHLRPIDLIPARDLPTEAQVYVYKIASAITVLNALYPLNSAEKVTQAVPCWNQIYDIIGFTTLDTDLENAILKHPNLVKLMPSVRRATIECEAAFEVSWADKIALARDPTDGASAIRVLMRRQYDLTNTHCSSGNPCSRSTACILCTFR